MTKEKQYLLFKWGGLFLFFCFLFYISYYNAFTNMEIGSPDEVMRYDIPKFIFEHGYLPRGDEKELVQNMWGISYGFTPYLPSIFSAFFMKIMSFFTTRKHAILVAARFISVLSGAGTWYFCTKIGEALTKKKIYIVLFTCLVCFLPQFVYLCSYLNNDAFSVFCSAWIAYYWIENLQKDWPVKGCILLGVGIGFMALTYYYAYAFILCSMIIYFYDQIHKKKAVKEILSKALIVFFVAFAIAGWYFIRNFIIYKGDFLGLSYEGEIAEQYAVDYLKPSIRLTPSSRGWGLWETFVHNDVYPTPWVISSIMSFIGLFGGMYIRMPSWVYALYCLFIFVGLLAAIKYFTTHKTNLLVPVNLVMCMIIPVLISMYYTYTSDFQAQGRYFISALIPLMLFITLGIKEIGNQKIAKIISFVYVLALVIIVFIYIRPNCFY